MEENKTLFEPLLERAIDYGKTSFDLFKLKALDQTTEVISSFVPPAVVIALIATFTFFLSFGFAIWLGEILGKEYYGFLLIAAFYGIVGIIIRIFMYQWIKKTVSDRLIKHVLK